MIDTSNLKDYVDATSSRRHCNDTLRELRKTEHKSKIFYVGATTNYQETYERLKEEKGLTEMYVLCKTKTKTQAESLEKKMVSVFGKQSNNFSKAFSDCPQTAGGEELEKGANYIYVMFGKRTHVKKVVCKKE